MAVQLNEAQKNAIKESTFPQLFMRRCIFEPVSTTHDRLKVHLYINDLNGNFININNFKSKNMKLAVFYYSGEDYLSLLQTFSSLQENKNFLKQNFLKEIFVKDFIGKNSNQSEYLSGGSYELNYIFDLELPNQNLKNVSIGAFFYNDAHFYSMENNINVSNIDFSLMESKIYSFNILKDGENETDKLFDLRLISKLQKKDYNLKNSIGITSNTISDTKLEKKFIDKKPNNYFTELYHSYDNNESLNCIFGFDKIKLLSDSVTSIKSTTSPEIDFSKSENLFKIISLSILKKEFVKNFEPNKKEIEKNNSTKIIIYSSEQNGVLLNSSLVHKNKKINTIGEIPLFSDIKTIHFSDSNLSTKNKNIFQYGVNVVVNNGFYTYLENIKKRLEKHIAQLKKYRYNSENVNFYSSLREVFYQTFNNVYLSEYQANIINIINDFIYILQETSLIQRLNLEDADNLSVLLSNLTDPEVTNSYLINKLIELFDSVYNEINYEIKKVKNINLNIEYWFKEKIELPWNLLNGYSYFYEKTEFNNFLTITSKTLISKIQNDILSYCNAPVGNNYNYYISPSIIFLENEKIYMNNFINENFENNKQNISDQKFKDIDIKIKLYEKFKNNEQKPIIADLQTNLLSCMDHSIDILNLFVDKEDEQNKSENGKYVLKTKKNINIDNLILSLLKQNFGNDQITINEMPFHVINLLKKQSKIFTSVETAYNDLNLNSKFLFLYNTLCKIEYLKTNGNIENIKNNSWKILNAKELNSLSIGEKILCRLNLFQISNNKYFDNFKEIFLPIYDKYFILENNVSNVLEFNLQEPPAVVTPTINKLTPSKFTNSQMSKVAIKLAVKENSIKQYTKIIKPYIPPRKVNLPLKKVSLPQRSLFPKNQDDF